MILTCTKCKKEKSETEFYVERRNKTGRMGSCKVCLRPISNANQKKYQLANKEKVAARRRAYTLAKKEKVAAYKKAYREANKKKISTHRKVWYAANRERLIAYSKAYSETHEDKVKEQKREHKKNHRGIYNAYERKRNALKLGNRHEAYRDVDIFERDCWICQICGQKINKKLKHPNPMSPSIDHIVSLIRGGDDAPTNVQATHLRCNMRKHTKCNSQVRLTGQQ